MRGLLFTALMASSAPALAAEPAALTLEAAFELSRQHCPALAVPQAEVDRAAGAQVATHIYPRNPALRGEVGARLGPEGTRADWSLEVEQPVEVGARRDRLQDAAEADLRRARAAYEAEERALRAQVAARYVEAQAGQALCDLEEAQAEQAQAYATLMVQWVAAGDAAPMEAGLARVEVARAQARLRQAEGRRTVALMGLADILGAGGESALPGVTPLALPPAARPVGTCLAVAREAHPELRSRAQAVEAAERRTEAADAAWLPPLGIGAFVRREAGRETIVGGGVTLPLPVFERRQGERLEGVAEARARRSEAEATGRRLEVEARAAVAELETARAAALLLRDTVLVGLAENEALLRQGVEAGKYGGVEVLRVHQQRRDATRELLELMAAARRAEIALSLACGD